MIRADLIAKAATNAEQEVQTRKTNTDFRLGKNRNPNKIDRDKDRDTKNP